MAKKKINIELTKEQADLPQEEFNKVMDEALETPEEKSLRLLKDMIEAKQKLRRQILILFLSIISLSLIIRSFVVDRRAGLIMFIWIGIDQGIKEYKKEKWLE